MEHDCCDWQGESSLFLKGFKDFSNSSFKELWETDHICVLLERTCGMCTKVILIGNHLNFDLAGCTSVCIIQTDYCQYLPHLVICLVTFDLTKHNFTLLLVNLVHANQCQIHVKLVWKGMGFCFVFWDFAYLKVVLLSSVFQTSNDNVLTFWAL